MRLVVACVVAVTSLVTAVASAQPHAAKPIVTVVRHGGLCGAVMNLTERLFATLKPRRQR